MIRLQNQIRDRPLLRRHERTCRDEEVAHAAFLLMIDVHEEDRRRAEASALFAYGHAIEPFYPASSAIQASFVRRRCVVVDGSGVFPSLSRRRLATARCRIQFYASTSSAKVLDQRESRV